MSPLSAFPTPPPRCAVMWRTFMASYAPGCQETLEKFFGVWVDVIRTAVGKLAAVTAYGVRFALHVEVIALVLEETLASPDIG